MKIAFYGNVANNFYQIVKALRQYSAVDAHLYVDNGADHYCKPESDDPYLEAEKPFWIHKGNWISRTDNVVPWRSRLIKELNKCDGAFVSGKGPMCAQYADIKYSFFVTGGDLTLLPFPEYDWSRYKGITKKLYMRIVSKWQRRGICKADDILMPCVNAYIVSLKRIKAVETDSYENYLPLSLDIDNFKVPEKDIFEDNSQINAARKEYDFILFHPSRLMVTDNPKMRLAGQWKRNDVLLRAFGMFLKRIKKVRAAIVMIDRRVSSEVEKAQRLISEIGIQDNVVWLKPLRPAGFARHEMISLYAKADVVADDFGVGWGWGGSVVMESLAMKKPLLAYVDEATLPKYYSWHPVISTNTEEEICAELEKLYSDLSYRNHRGKMGRNWIEEYHSPKVVSSEFVKYIHDKFS